MLRSWKSRGRLLELRKTENGKFCRVRRTIVTMGSHCTAQKDEEQQEEEETSPHLVTLLKTCAHQRDLHMGHQIHADIARRGLLEDNVFVGSALVNMYAKCGSIAAAKEVFDMLPARNVVSWTSLIAGYVELGYGEEALSYFEAMQCHGLSPDAVTFACILKACGTIGALNKGQEIHAQIDRDESLRKHIVVGTAVVDMYAKCGLLEKAQEVFDRLPLRNVVSWTALITGHTQHDNGEEALQCFERMQDDGLFPTPSTFPCILKACGSTGDSVKGREIHAKILKEGLLDEDVVVANALVDMYAKFGELTKAQEIFDELPVRDVVSWSALIGGYTQHVHDEKALCCFEQMLLEGPSPNIITYVCIIKSCGSLGAAHKGQEIHSEVVRKGFIEKDMIVGNALVAMYADCGMLEEAQTVFNKLQVRDIVSWNALLAGYARFGNDEAVFKIFDEMIGDENKPDLFSFTIVLNACSHKGLLGKGQMCFEFMRTSYGIIPDLEHHTCLVDLFGRAGDFDKVAAIIKEMPLLDNLSVWHSLLGACQKWANMEHGMWAFEHALQLDEKDAATYVYMSNVCAATGSQDG